MKTIKHTLLGLTMLGATALSAQSEAVNDSIPSVNKLLKSWTLGVRGVHLYDLPNDRFDTELERDPEGLNGDNTGFDIGIDAYIEKQFTPLFGLQLGYRYGQMTGSNGTEYYENTLNEGTLRALLIWSNLSRSRTNASWNYYTALGGSYGNVDAQRFLEADGIANREPITDQSYWSSYLALGTQYMINSTWRLELEVAFNTVYDDGFDGFNAATGSDSYLSTGVGIAYTFGQKEKPAMHATNYFAEPYEANKEARAAEKLAKEMRRKDSAMTEEIERNKQGLGDLQKNLDAVQKGNARRFSTIEGKMNEPVTTKDAVYVFFDLESSALSEEAKKALLQKLYDKDHALLVIGFADRTGSADYNARLKQARAESVRDFLVEVMGYDASKIEVQTGEAPEAGNNLFLNRRVEVRIK